MKIKIVDKTEFDSFAIKHPLNNLQQNSFWAEAESFYKWKSEFLLFFDDEKLIGGTMVLIKKWDKYTKLYSPRGILIDYNNKEYLRDIYIELKKYCTSKKAIFYKMEPYIKYQDRDVEGTIIGNPQDNLIEELEKAGFKHIPFSADNKLSNNRFITTLDISSHNIDDVYNNFTNKCKASIKKAADSCLSIRAITKEEIDIFYETVKDSAEYHSFNMPSVDYLKHLYDVYVENSIGEFAICEMDVVRLRGTFNKELIELKDKLGSLNNVESYKEKQKKRELENRYSIVENKLYEIEKIKEDKIILSASIFITINKTMYYFLSGNNREYINFNGSYLMQYEYIKKAIDHKLDCYNFLGISGIFDKNHPRYGVINFKRGFNSSIIEFIGEFDIVGNRVGYYRNKFNNFMGKIKRKIRNVVKNQ